MKSERGVAVAGLLLASVMCGPASAQQVRYAEASSTGGYGGGLIEYLVTGRADSRDRPTWPQPGLAPRRQTSISHDDRVPPYGEPSTMPFAAPIAAVEPSAPVQSYVQQQEYRVQSEMDPSYLRQEVAFDGPQRPGTIVVDTASKHLFLVQPGHRAIRYGIGVGRPGFSWSGLKTVSRKAEWPDWIPPAEMLARRPDLPRHMAGGPANPLGARALYLGSSLYRIHGTNEPHTIGRNVSSGCIRMMNEDVIDLYGRVPVGTRVEVL